MQKALRNIWNEFIYGGHLVALGPVAIVLVCANWLHLEIDLSFLILLYLITYIIHVFDRYRDINSDSSSDRIKHFTLYRQFLPMILIIFVVLALMIAAEKSIQVLFFTIGLLVVGFVYSFGLKKLTGSITGFKSFYVAATFASVVLFAAIYSDLSLSIGVWLLYVFFALRWFGNTVFCDIKDKASDQIHGLKTFAAVLSPGTFRSFLITVNFLSILPLVIGIKLGVLPFGSLLVIGVVPYYLYYLYLAYNKRQNIQVLCNVWADGESIVWLLLGLTGGVIWG